MKQLAIYRAIFLIVICTNLMAQVQVLPSETPTPTQMLRTEQVRVILTTPIQQTTTTTDCASAAPPGMSVEGGIPTSSCTQQTNQQYFKVVFEQSGRQFSVQLPSVPGEYLTIQIPEMQQAPPAPVVTEQATANTTPLPNPLSYAAFSPFPVVLYLGIAYSSSPFIGSRRVYGAPGGFRGRGTGRRH